MNIKKALSDSNRSKVLSGQQITSFIVNQLNLLEEKGIIEGFEKNINFKHRSYEYEDQFLANFVINTFDRKRIIVRSSNSFRSDRAKIGFYDLDGILRLSNLSDDIISTIYLVADQELQNPNFISLREKFINNEFYCPASHLFTLSEFVDFLQTYYDEKSSIFYEIKDTQKFKSLKEAGSYYGIKGNEFEKEVANIFNSRLFFEEYKKGEKTSKFHYIMDSILTKHNITKSDIVRFRATNSIPLLKNGGNPKTDIILEIYRNDGNILIETISVKNTTKKRVSCHDYKAEDFIRVLGCKGTKLEKYFILFQKYPTHSDFQSNLSTDFNTKEFSSLMKFKALLMTEWSLRGKHDYENLISPVKQVSNFILINFKNELYFFEYEKYIQYIMSNSKLTFSTPFSWTYPSKQRGKRIQLKMPILTSLD